MLYAHTPLEHVVKTTNGGAQWSRVGAGAVTGDVHHVTLDPVRTEVIFVFADSGVYRSADAGVSWARVAGGIGAVTGVAFDRTDTGVLYAAAGGRVLRSPDGGATWSELPGAGGRVERVAVSADGLTVYAASGGGGIVARPADMEAPAITIGRPGDGEQFVQGAQVATEFSCTDVGVSRLAECSGPATLDTGGVGERTFTVTAVDRAGNRTTRSVTYRVVPAAPPAPAVKVPAPTVKLTALGKKRLRLVVRAKLPKTANGRIAQIQYRRGKRWVRAARVKVPASGVVKRIVTLTRAKVGGPKAPVLRVRIALPRTASAGASVGKVRTVRIPAAAPGRRTPARR